MQKRFSFGALTLFPILLGRHIGIATMLVLFAVSAASAIIQTQTITATNIATDTITANEIAANAITTSELNADAVTSAKIAAGTIVASDIAAGTITATQIAADTITAGQIAANAIDTSELNANAVTAAKINVSSLSAISANMGSITSGSIVVGSSNKMWVNEGGDGILAIGGSTKASANFHVSAGGTSTITSLSADTLFAQDGEVYDLLSTNSQRFSNFAGAGGGYLCVDNSGNVYRSGSGC